jgi:hypothetical protein
MCLEMYTGKVLASLHRRFIGENIKIGGVETTKADASVSFILKVNLTRHYKASPRARRFKAHSS